ncbi:aldo/keto reductase [Actinophytocola sp.]|uniref:aldo/keto reductase n=1 Tax=Actinophytocola sp. TaxID=1872138 RepID=UPI002ED33401
MACLGVEVIDVLLLHCDDPARPVAELAETLLGVVKAGYAARIGVSNWPADRLATLARHLAEEGHRAVASYQFSLATPDPAHVSGSADPDILRVIREHHLPLLSWSSQARGFFARTASNGSVDPFDSERNRDRRARCVALAGQLGSRPETVALAWNLQHPDVWPSIGPRTTEQLDRSLAALRLSLTSEQVRWLEHGD